MLIERVGGREGGRGITERRKAFKEKEGKGRKRGEGKKERVEGQRDGGRKGGRKRERKRALPVALLVHNWIVQSAVGGALG